MLKKIVVAFLGIIALLYLLNIGAGIIELIPDNFPFIGNLDEASAVVLLLLCLKYFGFDLRKIFNKEIKQKQDEEQ
jgi:hypothetical protein